MNTPTVSLICPSYNHSKYIRYFIDSVLTQTDQNFELIIIDDASTDNSMDIVRTYNDPRIKIIQHKYNMGINAGLSDGICYAQGQIMCFVASDDILMPNYVESILNLFKKNPSANVAYVSLQYIDENSAPLPIANMVLDCDQTRYDLLRCSFFGTNPVPSPGMAFKKSAVMPHIPMPTGLLQYSDWDLHNKLLLNNDYVCTDVPLVKYRISSNSASARSERVIKREHLETDMLMETFLQIKNVTLFKKIFNGCYEQFGTVSTRTIPYMMARMALNKGNNAVRAWGYKTLINYISRPGNLELLQRKYGITYGDILSMVDSYKPYENEKVLQAKLDKYKRIWRFTTLVAVGLVMVLFFMCCYR